MIDWDYERSRCWFPQKDVRMSRDPARPLSEEPTCDEEVI